MNAKRCMECRRVLVAELPAQPGNWDGVTRRCEFCKAAHWHELARQRTAPLDPSARRAAQRFVDAWLDYCAEFLDNNIHLPSAATAELAARVQQLLQSAREEGQK